MTEILRPIGSIYRALDAIANREFQQAKLAKGQYLYLARIAEHPGIIQDHLATMVKVDRTTVARSVKKLEQQGLVEKRPDETNRKIRRLYVTEAGADVYPLVQRENAYSNGVALKGLTVEEATTLATLLEQVAGNVAADWERVKQGQTRHY